MTKQVETRVDPHVIKWAETKEHGNHLPKLKGYHEVDGNLVPKSEKDIMPGEKVIPLQGQGKVKRKPGGSKSGSKPKKIKEWKAKFSHLNEDVDTKRCHKCGKILPLKDFAIRMANKEDGRQSACREDMQNYAIKSGKSKSRGTLGWSKSDPGHAKFTKKTKPKKEKIEEPVKADDEEPVKEKQKTLDVSVTIPMEEMAKHFQEKVLEIQKHYDTQWTDLKNKLIHEAMIGDPSLKDGLIVAMNVMVEMESESNDSPNN